MLNRRQFTIAACCAFHAFTTARAEEAAPAFICVTREPKADGFDIQHFAGTKGGQIAVERAREFEFTQFGMATLADRWLPEDGLTPESGKVSLGIAFLDGTEAQRQAVREIAPEWLAGEVGRALAFDFSAPTQRAQLRISFTRGIGSFSAIGRQAKEVPTGRRTMNLGIVDRRTILHEFGHALGLRHEHHHPDMGIVWDEARVIADVTAMGWSRSEIRSNILERASRNEVCVGDPGANVDSIMMYPIKPEWTKNGFSSPQPQEISLGDRRCVAGLYPPPA